MRVLPSKETVERAEIEKDIACDWVIYQDAHRGDAFTVVFKKNSGEIVVAYHSDFFNVKIL